MERGGVEEGVEEGEGWRCERRCSVRGCEEQVWVLGEEVGADDVLIPNVSFCLNET